MKQGTVISAGAHAALIALAVFGLPDAARDTTPIRSQVTDVSIVSLDAFEAAQSAAPTETEAVTEALQAPSQDQDTPDTPEPETTPIVPDADVPVAPTTETAPDLSALEVAQPDVSTDVDAPNASLDAGAIGLDTPLIDAAPQDGSVNSTQTALLTPARPNKAPRIDTKAAPKPPEPVKEAPEAQEETSENPTPDTATPEEPKEAAAPKESATETVPDAKPEERPTTPLAATRPKGRPANLAAEAEKKRKAEEAAIAAALAAAQADTLKPTPQPKAEAAPSGSRLGGNFNSAQQRAVGDAIGGVWNKTLIEGKDNFENLVVTVRVRLTAAGKVMGGVDPVDPSSPQGDFKIAYEAARRAVLRAQPIPLPQDIFRDGDYLEIRFDPGRSAISLN